MGQISQGRLKIIQNSKALTMEFSLKTILSILWDSFHLIVHLMTSSVVNWFDPSHNRIQFQLFPNAQIVQDNLA